jgi:DNA mismatch endonuclease (patch repair protein)
MNEPARLSPGSQVGARFARLARADTGPEMELRRELHRRGFRYRVHAAVPGLPRRRIDILFPRARLAVSVDGCFWHGCPDHWTAPKSNADWWLWKIRTNQSRDADTDHKLVALGYESLRVWEHVDPVLAANLVKRRLGARARETSGEYPTRGTRAHREK